MPRTLAVTTGLAALAMVFFAANSVLGRLALTDEAISPADYTALRLLSGAATLALIILIRARLAGAAPVFFAGGSITAATALFVYAAAFSYAYLSLEAGMGALILFACVQATMIGWGLTQGERPAIAAWVGMALSGGAFIWLISPGLAAPDPVGAALMALSGLAWGIYSLKGRGAGDPVQATAANFLLAVPLTIGFWFFLRGGGEITAYGAALALASGIISSAIGYVIWYAALAGLSRTQGAIIQLSVPVITALGGALLLAEPLTLRLILAGGLILGGIALVILAGQRQR